MGVAVPSLWFLLAPGPALSSAPEGCSSSVSLRRLGLTGEGSTHSRGNWKSPSSFLRPSTCSALGEDELSRAAGPV